MNKLLLLLPFFLLLLACEDAEKTQEEELLELQVLRRELIELAESVTCQDSNDWGIIGIGAKACGGPLEYIPYPQSIDNFLEEAANYTEQSDTFNRKWGIISDCALTPEPRAVLCDDGKALLIG